MRWRRQWRRVPWRTRRTLRAVLLLLAVNAVAFLLLARMVFPLLV